MGISIFIKQVKLTRCGDEIEDGCGCKQPDKIRKRRFATIVAEWKKMGDDENGD